MGEVLYANFGEGKKSSRFGKAAVRKVIGIITPKHSIDFLPSSASFFVQDAADALVQHTGAVADTEKAGLYNLEDPRVIRFASDKDAALAELSDDGRDAAINIAKERLEDMGFTSNEEGDE